MKKFLLCLTLAVGQLAFINATQAATTPLAKPLKVLTLNFNSENDLNDPDFHVRDLRFAAIVKWAMKNDPDVILLEEAWTYHKDRSVAIALARILGYDVNYRLEMGFYKFLGEADAILAKKNLKMTNKVSFKLPHSAIDMGDGKTWALEFGAVSYATGAKLQLSNGESVYVYATHLTASTPDKKADQASAVIAHAKSVAALDGVSWEKANVIIGGDYNAAPDEPAAVTMINNGFVDTFGEVHPGDTSCSICENPRTEWFNPFTISAGLFPSQNGESDSIRLDYIFSHGPSLKPVASTLTFTAPVFGVWMSDHFGVTSVLADANQSFLESPTHDSDNSMPPAVIQTVTSDTIVCSKFKNCNSTLSPMIVEGAHGVVIENRSNKKIRINFTGPGYVFGNKKAKLKPNEQAAFTFEKAGDYTYTVEAGLDLLNRNINQSTGIVHVLATGL